MRLSSLTHVKFLREGYVNWWWIASDTITTIFRSSIHDDYKKKFVGSARSITIFYCVHHINFYTRTLSISVAQNTSISDTECIMWINSSACHTSSWLLALKNGRREEARRYLINGEVIKRVIAANNGNVIRFDTNVLIKWMNKFMISDCKLI